ncbi:MULTISPECIES: hypothetical protein [Empedobacter]|uniref:phage tail tube protein n=1 Tax=Empedobacter TaxID=59734 RepID=UPI002577E841|nr:MULTISPECIES: hypothetical protein [Empedobacter]MDM1547378.1 hypothetical protein [Empedobacter falsenii]
MATYTFGLAKVMVAEVSADGTMPETSTMTKIGEVFEDSGSLEQEEGETTEFKEEGNPIPKVVITKQGKITFKFNLMNVDPKMMADYIGGSVNVTSKEWEFDGKAKSVEKALYIQPEQGLYFKIPKASISAVLSGEMNQSNLITMNFTVTPLSPGEGKKSVLAGNVSDLPTG